jgi:site-specific DNA recombinase
MKIAALYARVSSQRQQRNETIASQLAALHDYARQHDLAARRSTGRRSTACATPSPGARSMPCSFSHPTGWPGNSPTSSSSSRNSSAPAARWSSQAMASAPRPPTGCSLEMMGVFAEYERALITERCRRGRLYRARQGQLWMKEAPYGYTYVPKTDTAPSRLLINEAEAEVIRLIFRWLIDVRAFGWLLTISLSSARWASVSNLINRVGVFMVPRLYPIAFASDLALDPQVTGGAA